jgi:hypothetical protein
MAYAVVVRVRTASRSQIPQREFLPVFLPTFPSTQLECFVARQIVSRAVPTCTRRPRSSAVDVGAGGAIARVS